MSKDYINQITIDYLLNKEQLTKQINNKITKSVNKKDKKFYRKRIFDLTKILLLNKEKPDNLSPDVKYAFDNYLRTCISYFKNIDNNDIIQEEYKDLEELLIDNLDDNLELIDENVNTKEEADKLMLRCVNMKPTLDNFIQKKSLKKENIILPLQKEINLDNPDLKTKGIKKKNINNKYGENNKSKEDKNEIKKEEDKI